MQSFHHGFGDVLSVLCNDLRHNWLGMLMLGTVALELYPREGSTIQFPTNDWASLFLGKPFLSFEIPQPSVLVRRDHEFLPTSDCSHSIAVSIFISINPIKTTMKSLSFFLQCHFSLNGLLKTPPPRGSKKIFLRLDLRFRTMWFQTGFMGETPMIAIVFNIAKSELASQWDDLLAQVTS